MLMPSLATVKERARRIICSNNQRQNTICLYLYANSWDDKLPPMEPEIGRMNASLNFVPQIGGHWLGLGRLYDTKLITDVKHLYCPSLRRSELFSYPNGWDNFQLIQETRVCGYLYRIFDQDWGNLIPQAEVNLLNNLRFSKIRGQMALTTDISGPTVSWNMLVFEEDTWPHRGKGSFGVVVGYSDGHVEFVHLPEEEYDRGLRSLSLFGNYGGDYYTFMFFKALDRVDFSELEAAIP